jgi:CobQ-like glutamine amidotransferase family enzyme
MAPGLKKSTKYSSSERSESRSSRQARTITLNICHLYPDLMNTYGDFGNIITLVKRCQWRGIEAKVTNVSLGNTLNNTDFDFYFFGGGQDRQQSIVAKDLKNKVKSIKTSVDKGAVLLSICGGYQLLQNYFKTLSGEMISGTGLFDAHTVASNDRMIQNLLIEIDPQIQSEIKKTYLSTLNSQLSTSLVGFENHSGKTYLGNNLKPLGRVLKGAGNNGEDKTEGAVYKNAFGCYLHGSLLPKNPHFADYLISKALERHYGKLKLKPLNDTIEWQAHNSTIKRIRSH